MPTDLTFPTVCFVPRGKAAKNPKVYETTKEDIENDIEILQAEKARRKLLKTEGEIAAEKATQVANQLDPAFDMDNYDNEDDFEGNQFFSTLAVDSKYAVNDPLLKQEDDSEDEDENEIKDTDLLIVAGSTDRDSSALQVYLWDEENHAFYVHHEFFISSFPLCTEWLNTSAKSAENPEYSNLIAVGSFDSCIEIWDLDEMDTPEPIQVLGTSNAPSPAPTKGKKIPKKKLNTSLTHTSAILSLHRHPSQPHILASASADNTIIIWDVVKGTGEIQLQHHRDKVQCVRWAHTSFSDSILASAGYDKKVCALDIRTSSMVASSSLPADAEALIWNRHRTNEMLCACEDGSILGLECRTNGESVDSLVSLWEIKNGDKGSKGVSCTGIADCSVPNLFITSSVDGNARVYSTKSSPPQLVWEKNLRVGPLFCVRSSDDEKATFSFGGHDVVLLDLCGEIADIIEAHMQ